MRTTFFIVILLLVHTILYSAQDLDVVLLTDNSGSMGQRSAGDRDIVSPVSRIQGTYNAGVNFIDDYLDSTDRAAHLRFCAKVDTPFGFTNDFNFAKAKLDTNVDGSETVNGIQYRGTAIWTGILEAVKYAIANSRPGVKPIVIALTDGEDNASGDYGSRYDSAYPNLGSSQQAAVDSVISYLISVKNLVKVYTINLGNTSNQTAMQNIANAGNGQWAYSADGVDLDSIFKGIGEDLNNVTNIPAVPTLEWGNMIGNNIVVEIRSLLYPKIVDFFLSSRQYLTLSLTGLSGQRSFLARKVFDAGNHIFRIPEKLRPGIYFFKVEGEGIIEIRKVLVVE